MVGWDDIADASMSEADLRQTLLERNQRAVHELRLQLRADGVPLHVVEAACAFAERQGLSNIQRAVPAMLQRMRQHAAVGHIGAMTLIG